MSNDITDGENDLRADDVGTQGLSTGEPEEGENLMILGYTLDGDMENKGSKTKKVIWIIGVALLVLIILAGTAAYIIIPMQQVTAFAKMDDEDHREAHGYYQEVTTEGLLKARSEKLLMAHITDKVQSMVDEVEPDGVMKTLESLMVLDGYYDVVDDGQYDTFYDQASAYYLEKDIPLETLVRVRDMLREGGIEVKKATVDHAFEAMFKGYQERGEYGEDIMAYVEHFELTAEAEHQDALKVCQTIGKQRKAYGKAEACYAEGNYKDAYYQYIRVGKTDVWNHETASEKATECFDLIRDGVYQQMLTYKDDENYHEAIRHAMAYDEFVGEDQRVQGMLPELTEAYRNQAIANAKDLAKDDNYTEAITALEKLNALVNEQEIMDIIEAYKADYKVYKIKTIKKLKKLVTIKDGDIPLRSGEIVPKGCDADYYNVDDKMNIVPRLTVYEEGLGVLLYASLGYEQQRLLRFNRVFINYGDKTVEWEVDTDTKYEIDDGLSFEVSTFFYTRIEDDSSASRRDFMRILEEVSQADDAHIIFRSDYGSRKHVVTEQEKENIKNIFAVYTMLYEDPWLWKHIEP